MRWFLRFGLSGDEKSAALDLIRHLQMMYAYQQLGMERLNDALMEAGMGAPGDERDVQTFKGQTTSNAVNEFVLPALIAKQDLRRRIGEFHTDFGRPSSPSLSPAYDDFANLLEIMKERARAQYDGWFAWVEDPGLDSVDTTALDLVEMKGLDTSIASLNALIKRANLKQEAWLVLNLEAFNAVRDSIGLSPLSAGDFGTRYVAGQSGMPARFFRD